MIESLRTFRLTRVRLAALAACSTLGTVAVVTAATGRTEAQNQALALLAQAPVLRRIAPAPSAARTAITSDPVLGGHQPSATAATSAPSTPAAASPGAAGSDSKPPTTGSATKPAKTAGHVFVIALSSPGYRAAFGHDSVARYLSATLRAKGTLLSGYHSLGGSELPDYLAMVSGQAPNPDTQANCASYDDFGAGAKPDRAGLLSGTGCVYPNTVTTIGDQITAAGSKWKAYLPDLGKQSCAHPNSGAADDAVLPFAGLQYDTRHNPFIYFHSLLDLGDCSTDDVSLNQLPGDLKTAGRTPRYSFIAPPLCDDSSASTCPAGQPGGLAGEDAFLRQWVPRIFASPAYRKNGVLMIVFAPSAPAPAGGATATTTTPTTATPTTPTTITPTTPTTPTTTTPSAVSPASAPIVAPPQGGTAPVQTGALILSSYATPGRTLRGDYDPYSLLRSVEDLLGLAPLAHAAGAPSFVGQALPGL
jgi:hypothetical protein